MVAILVLYILSKIYFRGRFWFKAEDIDLDSGRRYYPERLEDDENLISGKDGKFGIARVTGFFSG